MISGEDMTAHFAASGEESLADAFLRDPDGFRERVHEEAKAEADQWFDEQMALREAERVAEVRRRRRAFLARLLLKRQSHDDDSSSATEADFGYPGAGEPG